MNIQRVIVTKRPRSHGKRIKPIQKGVHMLLSLLAIMISSVVPITILSALYLFGLPGLLVSDGEYACNYLDFVGRYGSHPINYDCPYFRFRQIDLIP